jgi:hypothetical protein
MSHIPMILKNAFCFPSIGLYLLNIDGTPKVDENGLPIPVYTNDEIMSLYVFLLQMHFVERSMLAD